jgi:pimeloyl-ACP methyl ester carboxylesterase
MCPRYFTDPSHNETNIEVAGLRVQIRGLSALQATQTSKVDIVFLLHGRTSNAAALDALGTIILASDHKTLVVSFDQRNHGHRIVSQKANLTWTDGNTMHA